MKNNERVIYGITITIVIFLIANIIGSKVHLGINFIAPSFVTHTIMLMLSIFAIILLKNKLTYRISLPKFKTILKPIVIAVVLTIAINLIMTVVTKLAGGKVEVHPLFSKMNPLQVFLFVFIYASIAEEMLFRGFLLNFLKPLKQKGIPLFNRIISLSAIISAIMFGLAHLVLIRTGVSPLFLLRVVVFATCLGLLAGYYQEKYDNNSYAIIVHMAGNSLAVIAAFSMS